MTIDFDTGRLLAYNKGCVAISGIVLLALRDRWTSWRKAAAYSIAGYVAGSWAIHGAKREPWRPGVITGITRPLKPAGFYGDAGGGTTASGGGTTTASGGGMTSDQKWGRAEVTRVTGVT